MLVCTKRTAGLWELASPATLLPYKEKDVVGCIQLGAMQFARSELAAVTGEFHVFDQLPEGLLRFCVRARLTHLNVNHDFIVALTAGAAITENGEFHRRSPHAQVDEAIVAFFERTMKDWANFMALPSAQEKKACEVLLFIFRRAVREGAGLG